ncbi:hypothetical protein TCAL_13640 [Tigriopus californicus]|uniref:Carbohydrate sulfotransferase n=2 Tax=Tigriopus californicus TaxID=6832 RepID=A0A553PI15_TIGCA|nr:hypothetical protein TCAL_13640 [Tigriopus californicus]
MRGAQINVAVRYLNHSQNIEHIHLSRAIMSLKANERHHLLHNECSSIFQGRPRINPRGYTACVYGNEMRARRHRIKTVCEGHNGIRNRSELVTERFLIVKYRHLVWCPVYKAASTNWMVTLPSLTNFSPRDLDALSLKYRSQNELAQFVAKPRPKSSFEAYMALRPKPVTFLIVRHPFHRLLSAYRDKIEADNAYFFAKYGSGIVTKYRSEALERFGTTHSKHGTVWSPRPTFWEFIQAVLRDGLMDPHWHPISSWCGLCHLQFDFVIKFENLREEEDFLLGQLGLKNIVPISWENRNTQGAPWSLALQRHYFSALNSTEMKKLHELYRYKDLQSNPMDAIQYHVVGFTSLKWLWCPTFVGLAESNWVHNFMVLMGLSPTDIEDADSIYGTANPVTLVRLWAPELTKKSFALTRQDPDWKSILFVQHPIHRLVAFYQNNLEEYHDDSYYNLGIHIVETYRDQAKLRFQDFVQTVDDFKTPIELPHFWEYIQFVLDRGASGPYNLPHLIRPIYRLCDVCPGNYQYIVKTESIAQEDPFLFQKLGFPSDFQGHTTNKGYKYEKLMKDAPKYLEKISLEDQKRLHEMYRLDFELFGYHMKY